MRKWLQQRGGATLTVVLLIAAGVIIVIALGRSNKLKTLAAIDLLPI